MKHITVWILYVINVFLLSLAPPTVAAAAEIVRTNANSETTKIMKVYGRDKSVWQKALFALIDKDKLPEQLGGTLKRVRKENDLWNPYLFVVKY